MATRESAAALATGLLVGLAPSLLHVRGRFFAATNGGGPWITPGTGARRIGNALVVGHRRVLSLGIPVPLGKANRSNPDAPFVRGRAMAQQLREAVRAVPGVVGAEVTDGGTSLSISQLHRISTVPRRSGQRRKRCSAGSTFRPARSRSCST